MTEKATEQLIQRALEASQQSAAAGIYELIMVLGGIAIAGGIIAYVVLKIFKGPEKAPDTTVTHAQLYEKLGSVESMIKSNSDAIKDLKMDITSRFVEIDKDIRELRKL